MMTERLQLIPVTLRLCDAEGHGPDALARELGAQVPRSWPPSVFEPDDVARIRRRLEVDSRSSIWTLHYVLRRPAEAAGQPELVGVAGFGGLPTAEGVVDIGYAIAVEHQRRGYATEAVSAAAENRLRARSE
jgi:[ribosomal protein S5]-alanine N-acetyltransferase